MGKFMTLTMCHRLPKLLNIPLMWWLTASKCAMTWVIGLPKVWRPPYDSVAILLSCMTWTLSLRIKFCPPNIAALSAIARLLSLNQNCLVLTTPMARVPCVMAWANANILLPKKSSVILKNRLTKGRFKAGINATPTILACWPPLPSIMALIWKRLGNNWIKSTKMSFYTALVKTKWLLTLSMNGGANPPKQCHLKGCCRIWSAVTAARKAASCEMSLPNTLPMPPAMPVTAHAWTKSLAMWKSATVLLPKWSSYRLAKRWRIMSN